MKNSKFLYGFIIVGLFTIGSSCSNQNSKKEENVKDEPKKQSLWTDSLKTEFITSNSRTGFDRYVLAELIEQNEFEKDASELKNYLQTQEFDNYRNSKIKTYTVDVDNLSGQSKSKVEEILGQPNSKEIVNPSNTPCPCDKYNYLDDLVEIVFINGKADWITVNNSRYYVKVENSSYQSINRFDDYTYVKVKTK